MLSVSEYTDIVPDPPDGPPVIEAITGKTITLSWKRPKKLDPSFGRSIQLSASLGETERLHQERGIKLAKNVLSDLGQGFCFFFACSDSSSLLYVVQQQPLGSIQWSVVASNLRENSYTVTSLSKGVRYAFRVLTSTGKTLSKPSASTDLVQLLDRGKCELTVQ